MPDLYIISGPNGAGKTTAAKTILPETLGIKEFVNADEIARGLSPFNPEGASFEAGRIMLNRIHQLFKEKKSFSIETTLSSKTYLPLIKEMKQKGYTITLIFLWLRNVEIAKYRVAKRVSEGGHNIPVDVIERRYKRGLLNLEKYLSLVDSWFVYDNTLGQYELIAMELKKSKKIINFDTWQKILL
jgi:predicted ABC-type ATPase